MSITSETAPDALGSYVAERGHKSRQIVTPKSAHYFDERTIIAGGVIWLIFYAVIAIAALFG